MAAGLTVGRSQPAVRCGAVGDTSWGYFLPVSAPREADWRGAGLTDTPLTPCLLQLPQAMVATRHDSLNHLCCDLTRPDGTACLSQSTYLPTYTILMSDGSPSPPASRIEV